MVEKHIEILEEYLSKDRISTYLKLANGNREKAIELYIKNKAAHLAYIIARR
jgi:hypothetical protein